MSGIQMSEGELDLKIGKLQRRTDLGWVVASARTRACGRPLISCVYSSVHAREILTVDTVRDYVRASRALSRGELRQALLHTGGHVGRAAIAIRKSMNGSSSSDKGIS
jgi:hypothetical protein